MSDTRDRILEIIARISEREPESLHPDHRLGVDLGLDSAKALELLVDLEDTFDTEIDEAAATGVETVGDVLGLLGAA